MDFLAGPQKFKNRLEFIKQKKLNAHSRNKKSSLDVIPWVRVFSSARIQIARLAPRHGASHTVWRHRTIEYYITD